MPPSTAETPWASRPLALRAVDAPKPWGSELWLTSTRPEAPSRLAAGPGTLAEHVASHPEVLGPWSRRLFGDGLPIFTKLIHTRFPPRVHLGFRRPVDREELLAWLEREQALLRRWLSALRIADESAFGAYQERYAEWASGQALASWCREDDDGAALALRSFVDPGLEVGPWLRSVRVNRAAFVDTLNEIDMAGEAGHLFLSSAGVVHAIFGLSHQTHPRDTSRSALEALFAVLSDRVAAGATDLELSEEIDRAGLSHLRERAALPPKNEAWLPTVVDGLPVLVEPQQSSDTTYSLADFFTPLVWGAGGVRFRKGSPAGGLSRDQLLAYLAEVDLGVTTRESVRRAPRPVEGGSSEGAELSCLVDEPATWPFFTAYQLELTGRFVAAPPPGVAQQIVVTRGRVELRDDTGVVGELSPRAPAFVPATAPGRYTLVAVEPATVLFFAVPGARGGAPRL